MNILGTIGASGLGVLVGGVVGGRRVGAVVGEAVGGVLVGGVLGGGALGVVLGAVEAVGGKVEQANSAAIIGAIVGALVGVSGGGVAVIDKYVNQNITNNKVAQYGLTALEGLTVSFILTGKPQYINNSEISQNPGPSITDNIICHSIIILSALMFKFIWDQDSNATDDITTPELDDSLPLEHTGDISIKPSILSSINTFGSYCKNICNDMSIQLMGLSTRLKSYIWDRDSNATDDITTPELDDSLPLEHTGDISVDAGVITG